VSAEDAALQRLSAALDELAAADAAELLAEARIEARARVRSLLAEALAERMLAQAECDPAAPGPRPRRPHRVEEEPPERAVPSALSAEQPRSFASPAAPEEHELGWYVYGIVREDFAPPALRGVEASHALEVVRAAGLGALTSRVALSEFGERELQERMEDLAWLERHARRHEQILETVLEQRATVVPMRLFTIYESTASLTATLEREREFLGAALERLADRTEWGVKLFAARDPESEDGEPEQSDASGPGESYMRRRRAADARREQIDRRFEQLAEQAHDRLAAVSVEARVNPLQPPELSGHEGAMLMNGVYLVENEGEREFRAELGALREEYAAEGVDVVITGPWPPYNFVNSSQEAGV
jgi:hypothetical protein